MIDQNSEEEDVKVLSLIELAEQIDIQSEKLDALHKNDCAHRKGIKARYKELAEEYNERVGRKAFKENL